MSRRRLAVVALGAAFMLAGCSQGEAGPDPSNPDQLEIVSWWASGPEQDGLFTIVRAFEDANPDIDFFDSSVRGDDGTAARSALRTRLASNNPPDIMMVAGGAGMTDYLDAGQLMPLDDFYAQHGLNDVLRPEIIALLSRDATPFAVPVDVHRANVLWSNNAVVENAGLSPETPATSIGELVNDLEVLRASGVKYPLALGGPDTQLVLFDSVLLSTLGPDEFSMLWSNPDAWGTTDLEAAVASYALLLSYTDPSDRALDELRVARKVAYGDAAYVVLVDTALPVFNRAGAAYSDDYEALPFPGTKGVFAAAVDAFAVPEGAAHELAAGKWLDTLVSTQVQRAVSVAKGSVPARADVDAPTLPPYQQSALVAFQQDQLVPSAAAGMAASQAWTSAYSQAVSTFCKDRRVDAFLAALRSAAKS